MSSASIDRNNWASQSRWGVAGWKRWNIPKGSSCSPRSSSADWSTLTKQIASQTSRNATSRNDCSSIVQLSILLGRFRLTFYTTPFQKTISLVTSLYRWIQVAGRDSWIVNPFFWHSSFKIIWIEAQKRSGVWFFIKNKSHRNGRF